MPKTRKPKLKENDYYQTPETFHIPFMEWLGIEEFSCDPCSPKEVKPWNFPATIRYTEEENGLDHEWGPVGGHVLLNSPYSKVAFELFIRKAIKESRRGVHVWILANQSNSYLWQREINQEMVFKINLKKRIKFIEPNGIVGERPEHDNVLAYLGPTFNYLNDLLDYPDNFPFEGELIYQVKPIGGLLK